MGIMSVGTLARKLFGHLLPTLGMTPGALGVNLGWLLVFCFSVSYLLMMPSTVLPEVSFQDFTALYMTAAWASLVLLLPTMAGIWALYTYLYIVTVTIARPLEQGRSVAHQVGSVAGAGLLRVLIRLAHVWALILGTFLREPALFLTLSPLRCLRLDIPARLAVGWRAGTHPSILYAHTLR